MDKRVVSGNFDQDQSGELALLAVSGSHAYGLAHEDSDLDLRGVFVGESADFFKLGNAREQVVMQSPDIAIFELRKFCRLAAQGNPNIVELLFAPSENIVVTSETWTEVMSIREAFLSRVAYDAYRGYAKAQWYDAKKLAEQGEAVHRWKERTRRKHLGHVFRVLDEGEQLFKTGQLSVRVADVAALRALTERPIEDLVDMVAERVEALGQIPCPFPDEADWATIDSMLVGVRERMLERTKLLGSPRWNLSEVDYASRGWPSPLAHLEENAPAL